MSKIYFFINQSDDSPDKSSLLIGHLDKANVKQKIIIWKKMTTEKTTSFPFQWIASYIVEARWKKSEKVQLKILFHASFSGTNILNYNQSKMRPFPSGE